MSSIINKRQQARNERALQDLIKNVPGNDRCADCSARNPSWASWNLGCFLCMRCAALHRKLGTHITKVKSLSMDSWSLEQVENMKRNGNVAVNRIYNPRNIKPNIPVDVEEVDGALERYVREKYQQKSLVNGKPAAVMPRHHTGSSSSTDDTPPAVPAKDEPRFGLSLRSASSQSAARRLEALRSDGDSKRMSSIPEVEPLGRKRSFDLKLAQLREMGFPNAERNSTILKGVGGNMDKAVESLIRLGEGGSDTRVRAQVVQQRSQQRLQPQTTAAPPQRSATTPVTSTPWTPDQSSVASNDSRGATPSLSPQATSSYNPFHQPSQQQQQLPQQAHYATQQQNTPLSFEGMFQTMTVSQPQTEYQQQQLQPPAQPLFPHNTGNTGNTYAGLSQPQAFQSNPFLRTFTPPMTPQFESHAPSDNLAFRQPLQSPPMVGINSTNPFLRTSRSQNFVSSNNPFGQPLQQDSYQQNFGQVAGWFTDHRSVSQPAAVQSQQIQHTGQNFFTQPQFTPQVAQSPGALEQHSSSPPPFDTSFQQHMHSQTYPQPVQHYSQLQPPQPLYPQATGRYDKASILALYNAPHLAPARPAVSHADLQAQPQQQGSLGRADPATLQQQQHLQHEQSSSAGSMNPFANLQQGTSRSVSKGKAGHVSNDSVDFVGLMGGRHSPDAFKGLSARVR